MNLSWKLLPLAAAAALSLLVLAPGTGLSPNSVSADAHDIDAPTSVVSGVAFEVDIDADADDGNLRVWSTGVGDTIEFEYTTLSGEELNINTNAASFPDNGNITVTVTIECDGVDNFQIHATQDTTVSQTIACNPTSGTVTPTVTGTVTGGASIVLTVYPTTPVCNSIVIVSAVVKNAQNEPVNGASVTFSAPAGTFQNTIVTTVSGVASTFYTPPSTGNQIVNVTSSSGSLGDTKPVTVTCAAATATSVPPTAVPPTVAPSTVRPPSTGDGGLADGSSSWGIVAGLALVAGTAFAGALVVARRRA